jgi:hypothetical protein
LGFRGFPGRRQERGAQALNVARIELSPVRAREIENVDGTFTVSRNMCRMDGVALGVDRAGKSRKQGRAVSRIHFNDRRPG